MLSSSHQAHLLNAVPSFVPTWERLCTEQAEYETRFPKGKRSEPEWSHEFRVQLARHLAARVAQGELHEAEWLFAALEELYREGNPDLDAELTVGLLESLIHAVEAEGVADAAILHPIPKGPVARGAWEAAYAYTHHGRR